MGFVCWWRSTAAGASVPGRAVARAWAIASARCSRGWSAPPRRRSSMELVALSSRDGRAVQDFAAVCRATLQGDSAAERKLRLVAFDLLELAR